jgi:hypothetical protein
MNYNAATEDEPAGEVLLRGPQLFSGYYKQVRPNASGPVPSGRTHTHTGLAQVHPAIPCLA